MVTSGQDIKESARLQSESNMRGLRSANRRRIPADGTFVSSGSACRRRRYERHAIESTNVGNFAAIMTESDDMLQVKFKLEFHRRRYVKWGEERRTRRQRQIYHRRETTWVPCFE